MKDVQLILTDPCLKQWDDLKPSGDGRYCSSCKKNIIDLSTKTDQELIQFFKSRPDNVCGRVLSTQLNRKLLQPASELSWQWMVPFALSAMVVLPTQAQKLKPAIVQGDSSTNPFPILANHSITVSVTEDAINGMVMDSKTSKPLTGVKIRQKGFDNVLATTDNTGRFKLSATNDILNNTFIFELEGYARVETAIKEGIVLRLAAASTIRLGGVSLAGMNNEPLYIVQSGKKSCTIDAARMKEISPDWIEKLEVYKDAQATALYGSKAANGVILIGIKKAYAKKFDFSKK